MRAIVDKYNEKHKTSIDGGECVFDMYDFSQKWVTSDDKDALQGAPLDEDKIVVSKAGKTKVRKSKVRKSAKKARSGERKESEE